MDFALSPDQVEFRQEALDFARTVILPVIKEYDQKHSFPHKLIPLLADRHYFGICLPVRYGGAGRDYLTLGLLAEALEWADSAVRETLAVHLGLHALPIFQWGTEAQKQHFLPPLATGQKLACFGLNEPAAGSDVANLQTVARKEGDHYILNGEKNWITLADVADALLVFAKTEPDKGAAGISAFILERGWLGLTTGTIRGKMGVWSSNTGWIKMVNVAVPESHRLGEEGEGFKIAMSALDTARYVVAAGSVGLMKSCLEESVVYARRRRAFGNPIGDYQLIQQMIALMQQRIDLAELLVYQVGWLKNQGLRNSRESSMAKWYCTEAANATANDAVQILGAYGYSDEYNAERHLRNSKAAVIYQGTSQIHQLIQAAYALNLRQDKPLRRELPAYDPEEWRREAPGA